MRKGFTLLELLVVVIIIAILASIAVPQFFRAAERARAAEGVNVLGVIRSSQLRYYAEHGVLTNNCADLDFEVSTVKYFTAPDGNAIGSGDSCKNPTYTGGTEIVAEVKRNAFQAGGYNYTLQIQGNGDIVCTGEKCPPGF